MAEELAAAIQAADAESTDPPFLFYHRGQPGYEFTNFYDARFQDEQGREWKTSEHYFQAHKFAKSRADLFEEVRGLNTPRETFEFVRRGEVQQFIDPGWQYGRKDQVMLEALRHKFAQYPALLMSSGKRRLVEHTENDRYWGDGGDGKGKNMLGKLLMVVRAELNAKYPDGAPAPALVPPPKAPPPPAVSGGKIPPPPPPPPPGGPGVRK
eukprot:Hpha_TRINITY_DN15533_c3_g9::TRINITY_DN15533_c3_g9_i1::g.105256::m.105256/K09935/K09935; uncharacterized protein